jgi:hypothetical protein
MGGDGTSHPVSGPNAFTKRRVRGGGDLTDFYSPMRNVGQVTQHLSHYRMNPMKGFVTDQLKRYSRTFVRQAALMTPAAIFFGGIVAWVSAANEEKKQHHYH